MGITRPSHSRWEAVVQEKKKKINKKNFKHNNIMPLPHTGWNPASTNPTNDERRRTWKCVGIELNPTTDDEFQYERKQITEPENTREELNISTCREFFERADDRSTASDCWWSWRPTGEHHYKHNTFYALRFRIVNPVRISKRTTHSISSSIYVNLNNSATLFMKVCTYKGQDTFVSWAFERRAQDRLVRLLLPLTILSTPMCWQRHSFTD